MQVLVPSRTTSASDRRSPFDEHRIAQEFDTAEVLAPERPVTMADSGLSRDTLTSAHHQVADGGEASGMDLADHIRLLYNILEPHLEHLRIEMLACR